MTTLQNNPLLWRDKLPVHDPQGHKYDRGIAVIFGARKMTGATRLAARAAARMGAGLVKVVAPEGTGEIYRSTLHEEIIVEDIADFKGLDDPRIRCVLIGPGWTKEDAEKFSPPLFAMLASSRPRGDKRGEPVMVLDAGAFTAWRGGGDVSRVVVTPHEGEFAARFGTVEPKIEKAVEASGAIGATVVLKGPLTVIAGEGDVVVQDRTVPELATAGTGDVLAGMIAGLIAQGMDVKWASAASVWIHAEGAARFGRGMVAGDIPEIIPQIFRKLLP